ncbi:MAG: hypothetical protein JSV24_06560 [Bacteroidales bacterium]|nr:MAG: hypothetical protein JSV24_06560 [Bacteroidales bacterium]
MKPFHIFLIFFIILLLLLLISFISPPHGLEIVKGFTLRFPDYNKLIEKSGDKPFRDITYIVEKSEVMGSEKKKKQEESMLPAITEDDESGRRDSIIIPAPQGFRPDSLKKLIYPLSYPENDSTVIYPFFMKLDRIQEMAKPVRVLHYGDSQIEGDRVTSYIRETLQKEFGGYGPGLFAPEMVVSHTVSLKQSVSSNWNRFTIKDWQNGIIEHNRLGIMLNFGRFVFPDNSMINEGSLQEAEINFEPSGLGYPRVDYFDLCRIFYGFNRSPVVVEICTTIETDRIDTLPETRSLNIHEFDIGRRYNRFSLKFRGADSPDIYGISLESKRGIIVDNIPVRGSSGLEFSASDRELLGEMLNELNAGLIILEFGVNVAPHIVQDYTYYENALYRQLGILKALRPDMSVLVMGISDLSRKINDTYESYPNITLIRDAQKKAAFKAGCAFWDTYEAMGGENSMPSWVFSDPPLARPDFIHFSYLGSKVIGEMFCNALMRDYNQYLLSQKKSRIGIMEN